MCIHLRRMYPKMMETQSPMQMSSNAKMATSACDHACESEDSRPTYIAAATASQQLRTVVLNEQ